MPARAASVSLLADAGRRRRAPSPGTVSGELHGVGVPQLVRREAAPDTGLGGEPAELAADGGA
jgi:hypothetical protein